VQTKLGVLLTAATATVLVVEWWRHRARALPLYGWLGLAAYGVFEWMKFRQFEPVYTFFTCFAWTCYILIADAAVFAVNGRSRLQQKPVEFARIALLSIPLWLVFEAYNLYLRNWTYVGLPENLFARGFGYAWAFATITPAIFVTADLIRAFGWWREARPVRFSPRALHGMTAAGALLLLVPLVVPQRVAAYLFAPVWLGFVLLLDPANYRLGRPSLLGDLELGRRDRLYGLLLSGWVCGLLWEFWNFWAGGRWLYIFPMFQGWKIFEMPAPGFLGFPPFALECFTMYVFVAGALGWVKKK
jgi:hypothetical protein